MRQRGALEKEHSCGGFAHQSGSNPGDSYLTFAYAFRHRARDDVTLVGDLHGFNFDKHGAFKNTSDQSASTMTVQGTVEIIKGDHQTLL